MAFSSDNILRGKKGFVYISDATGTPSGDIWMQSVTFNPSIPIEKLYFLGVDGPVTIPGDLEANGTFSGKWVTGDAATKKAFLLFLANNLVKMEVYLDKLAGLKLSFNARLTGAGLNIDANTNGQDVSFNYELDGAITPSWGS